MSFEGVVTESVYSEATGRLIEQRFFDNLTQYNNGLGLPVEKLDLHPRCPWP